MSSAVIVVACGALLAAALAAEGYRAPELELHDAGVWLSRETDEEGRLSPAVGRENTQLQDVDVTVLLSGATELFQADATVLVHPLGGGVLCSIDGRNATVTASAQLPADAIVALGGSGPYATAAVLDPAAGDLWVARADTLVDHLPPATQTCAKSQQTAGASGGESQAEPPAQGSEPADDQPAPSDQTVEGAKALAVGADGVAWAYEPKSGKLVGFDSTGARVAEESIKTPGDHAFQLTLVGRTPIVLDENDLVLRFAGGGSLELDEATVGSSPRLQAPGPERDSVVFATTTGLFAAPLDGGEPVDLISGDEVAGEPAEPLVLPACSYGAWGGNAPAFARRCGSAAEPEVKPLPVDQPTGPLAIRTNRNKVVVNDLRDGSGFLIGDEEVRRALWTMANLTPDSDDPSDSSTATQVPDEEQVPPVAVNDTGAKDGEEAFATRPGRAVVVHPMRNDYDANDDVLVIRDNLEDLSGCDCLRLVEGGLAVQVSPPAGWLDDIRFRYTISDGISTDASAESVVEIHEDGENEAPTLPPQSTTVRSGGTVRHNVLADARDPDGDAVGLVLPVAQPAGGGSLTAASDGLITFTAPGGTADQPFTGTITVPFTITDGLPNGDLQTELTVKVVGNEQHPPTARGDHAVAVVNHEVVVDVLANDSDPDGDPLRITQPGSSPNAEVRADEQGRLHITPHIAGPLVLTYSITDGFSGEVPGKVRVDVSEQSANQAPVAVRDDIVLPAAVAGSAETPVGIVDALANDFDPDGDVLVLEGVDVAESAGLAVEVIDHRFLRARATRALTAPAQFTYSVTDGNQRDATTVVVRPGSVGEPQAPHAVDDSFTVRAGAVAALDVLRNDTDPEGARLEIRWDPAQNPAVAAKQVFVQDGKLRFQAPIDVPSIPIQLQYSAEDPDRRTSNTGVVQITVLADKEPNRAPQPVDLTARTLAGQEVVIPIPVTTMDPDGDDVTLLGLAEGDAAAPQHGAVIAVGTDRLTYRPDVWAGGFWGTDSFQYRVRDDQGDVAVGTIRVGVAAPAVVNHPPVAIDDIRQSGPDGITIDAIRNDSDPDGDHLELVSDAESPRKTDAKAAWTVEVEDGRIRFDPKGLAEGATATFTYKVTDGVMEVTGRVSVTMAQLQPAPPLALDDRGPATLAGEPVQPIDVLANDIDPDGPRAGLTIDKIVAIAGLDEASLPAFENPIRFTMPAHDVILRYTVKDENDQTADALIRVRLASPDTPFPPSAIYDKASTDQGEPVSIKVLDNDVVTPGRKPQVLGAMARPNGTCQVAGDEIVYTPDATFSGWGGCAYVLGDGPGDSPDTLKAIGTVGVEVKASGNTPPRFVPQRLTTFADKKERTFPLRAAVIDVDDPEQAKAVCLGQPEGATEGITATIDDEEVLHLTAASGTPEGSTPLNIKVSDCDAEAAEPGVITVLVSKYDGPLASLANDPIKTTQKVPTEPVNVLANDSLAGLGDPLTIKQIDSTELAGGDIAVDNGTVTATADGSVMFTPNDDFHGVTTFTYTVDDGSKDPSRFQTATVTVTVVGFPEPPPIPNLTAGNRSVVLSWGVPADNGAPIDGYLVRVLSGGQEVRLIQTSAASTYDVTDLTNGTQYQFQVAALNESNIDNDRWGEAVYSTLSPAISPNTNPVQLAAPVARFVPTGGAIDVSWNKAEEDGTGSFDRMDYTLVVSPPAAGVSEIPNIDIPSKRVEGLTNGTEYTFTVQAFGYKTDGLGQHVYSSLVSPPSAPEIPAAPPSAPAKPTITYSSDPTIPDQYNITVHWDPIQAPADNGDAVATYHVAYYTGGVLAGVQDVPGSASSTTVYGTDNNKKYTFAVTAENKAGEGASSPQSDPVNSSGSPGAVGSVSASEGDTSSTLTFTEPTNNGAAIDGYQWRTTTPGVGAWVNVSDTDAGPSVALVADGLANGSTYQFQVRARNTSPTGQVRWGTESPSSNSARPFGTPFAPTGLSGSNNSATLTWAWGQGGLNGHDNVIGYEVSLNGGSFGSVGLATSYQVNVNAGECRTLSVREIGNRTVAPNRQTGSATGGVQACAPSPTVSISVGSASSGPCWATGDLQGCYNVRIDMSGFSPGNHSVKCYSTMNTNNWQLYASFSAGNGVHQQCSYSMAGRWVAVVVDGDISSATWPNANGCGFADNNHTGAYSGCSQQWPTN